MKNIAVFVSGGGSNLQALIDGIKNNIITNAKIALVLSSKDNVYALERAMLENIEAIVLKRKDYPDGEEYSEKIMKIMENYNIDLIVLAGFTSVLSSKFVKKYENKIMNTHPTLIPAFCGNGFYGIKVHEKVLERGVKISGATVHFANEITDGGPIIMQKAIDVKDDDTPESLQKRIMVYGEHVILPQAVNLFCNDRLQIENDKVTIVYANQ